jgi:hypothetical protein
MPRHTREFSVFGVDYRTTQFSAYDGLGVMEIIYEIPPERLLAFTEVRAEDGSWHSLSVPRNINHFVKDAIGFIAPLLVLKALLDLVNEYSFGFLGEWKGIKVPTRFLAGFKAVSSQNAQPLISQLVQDGVADLRSLQEYYSLEEAFKLFDIVMAKGVNDALANEAASKPK